MMEIQFDMELDTPLGGKPEPALLNGSHKRGVDKRRTKKDRKPEQEEWETAERVYPSTSSPSTQHRNFSTSHKEFTSPNRTQNSPTSSRERGSPKAYRSSLPHTLTLAPEPMLQAVSVNTTQKQIINDTSSYQHLKMKYMRSLNFTPEELKSIKMRGRERSQTISLPLGQSMPIPVSGGMHGLDESRLSSSVYDGDDMTFVPPHELVRHDETFSVWHYEQKKIASKEAV